jgi:hypothetical protein
VAVSYVAGFFGCLPIVNDAGVLNNRREELLTVLINGEVMLRKSREIC